jgi:uncharacterized protein YggE
MRTLAVATLIVLMSCELSAAQTVSRDEPMLTVRGHGRVEVPPDHALLTVELVTKGNSLQATTAAHRERAPRATKALRDLKQEGLEIERSVFRLNEVRPPPTPGQPGRSGTEYQAVTTFELKATQLAKIDSIVTAIAATSLFEVRNLRFAIEEKNAGLNAARKSAVADARERAISYAEAAGVQLGDIVRIEDSDTRIPREFAADAAMMRSAQVIPPETLTLSASVTITWRISAKR